MIQLSPQNVSDYWEGFPEYQIPGLSWDNSLIYPGMSCYRCTWVQCHCILVMCIWDHIRSRALSKVIEQQWSKVFCFKFSSSTKHSFPCETWVQSRRSSFFYNPLEEQVVPYFLFLSSRTLSMSCPPSLKRRHISLFNRKLSFVTIRKEKMWSGLVN